MSVAAGTCPVALRIAPAIVLSDVSKVHPGGVRALDEVSLTVD